MIDKEEFNKALGKRIESLRRNKKMTLTELGIYLGVSGQQIAKYETGENIKPYKLAICSRVFNVPISYFYGEAENINSFDKSVVSIAAEISTLPNDVRENLFSLSRSMNRELGENIIKKYRDQSYISA